ncbi:MAG: 7TM diverse intracellular signaling domain-containing protein, partial [Bacillota bacterium]
MARIWALVLLLVSTSADAAFYFVREGQIVRLGPEISYLVEDPKSPRTFEDVSRASDGWISQKDKPYAAADGPASIWMRFDVPADIGAKPVFINVPLWEHEEFFIVRDGALVDRERAGGALKRSERTVRVTMIPVASAGFAPLEVKPGARTTVYAHLETSNRYYSADLLLARLWDADRVLEGERRDRLVQGIFYGVLFFLISYNLALFLVVRESAFLYYVLMELGFATTWTAVTGVSVEYLTPNHPGWDFYYVWIGGAIGGFGGWQFVREFLDTRKHFPRMDRALALIAYANFLV